MNILLVCGAGASTSYLVTRMEKVSRELGRDDHIWAIAQTALKFEVGKADVVLLGPQITYMLEQVQQLAREKGIPAAVIRLQDYGMCDGAKILAFADELAAGAEGEGRPGNQT